MKKYFTFLLRVLLFVLHLNINSTETNFMQLDPAITPTETRRASKGSDVLTIFIVNTSGSEYEIQRNCTWEFEERTPGSVLVWVKLNEDFTEIYGGKPEDLSEQISDELGRLYEFKNLDIEKLILL